MCDSKMTMMNTTDVAGANACGDPLATHMLYNGQVWESAVKGGNRRVRRRIDIQIRYRQGDIDHRRLLGDLRIENTRDERRDGCRDAKVHKVPSA
jgi:hypothetical protein